MVSIPRAPKLRRGDIQNSGRCRLDRLTRFTTNGLAAVNHGAAWTMPVSDDLREKLQQQQLGGVGAPLFVSIASVTAAAPHLGMKMSEGWKDYAGG